jgi:chromosome segregation ATPase
MKNPKELTNYIEIISGSTFFKKDQEDLKEEIKNLEDHMNSRSLRIAKLRQEKKLMKTFNHKKKSSLKIEAEYELVLKQLVLAKALLSELDLKDY